MKNSGLLLLCCTVTTVSLSQPFTLRKEIDPVKLEFHKFTPAAEPKAKGRLNVTNVTQVKDTMYFFASGISIYSPVYVGLTTADKENPLQIRLAKMNWNNTDRSGNTGNKGHWDATFKTENDFGIMVIAPAKPATYSLVVWNGDEVNFKLPSVFSNGDAGTGDAKNGDKTKKGGGGFLKENGLYIIIGLLVVIIGILLLRMKGRKTT